MKKLFLLLPVLFFFSFSPKEKQHIVEIRTDFGTLKVKLFNETPQHRDNFLKLVNESFYDSLLFHRVIKNFMIQGGDPDSKHAAPGTMLGNGDLGYKIPAEIFPTLFHQRGVLAAARDDNPEKASSACQFYLVQGKVLTDEEMDAFEKKWNVKIPVEHRTVYKTIGGTPWLDGNYTVFGEVIEGLNIIDSIANVKCDGNNRPLTDIRMYMHELKPVKK